MTRLVVFLVCLLQLSVPARAQDFLAQAHDETFLTTTITAAKPAFAPPEGVTGITVPHHLLAADLIARGFWAASQGRYERVILIAPDHFRLVKSPFAVVTEPMQTVLGTLEPARSATDQLLNQPDLFTRHPDHGREHSIHAVLPFIAHFFPEAEVLAIVASNRSTDADWQNAVEALHPLLTPRTLVIQSTDYSHYLSVDVATQRDQEMLGLILSGQSAEIGRLVQPDYLDSKAAQYVQMRLQQHLGAQATVLANRNSVEYGTDPSNTTSYIVTAYHRDPAALSRADYSDQDRIMFGGDVLTGRFVLPVLLDAQALAAVLQTLTESTGGAPLVVNLEGVIADDMVANAPAGAHLMPADISLPTLRNMGVVAASLANNHSMDFGLSGLATTQSHLDAIGVKSLPHGEVVDLGPLRVLGLNFLPGPAPFATDMDDICQIDAKAPIVAFVHWGREYTATPSEAEFRSADALAACGFAALIGTHSHRADAQLRLAVGRMPWTFSLGNLLFDQNDQIASGQIAELRIFEAGTIAMRLIPVPNLFEVGRDVRYSTR